MCRKRRIKVCAMPGRQFNVRTVSKGGRDCPGFLTGFLYRINAGPSACHAIAIGVVHGPEWERSPHLQLRDPRLFTATVTDSSPTIARTNLTVSSSLTSTYSLLRRSRILRRALRHGMDPCPALRPLSHNQAATSPTFQSVLQSWEVTVPLPARFPSNPKPTDGMAVVSTVSGSVWEVPQYHW